MSLGTFVPCICVGALGGNPECVRHPSGAPSPLDVACPKCAAGIGRNCNPHIDAKTGKPVYREPHKRRVAASLSGSDLHGR